MIIYNAYIIALTKFVVHCKDFAYKSNPKKVSRHGSLTTIAIEKTNSDGLQPNNDCNRKEPCCLSCWVYFAVTFAWCEAVIESCFELPGNVGFRIVTT